MDLFDVKRDVIQSLSEAGFDQSNLFIDDKTPGYFHPGKSGAIYLNKNEDKPVAYFGEIHPNIIKKLDIKTEAILLSCLRISFKIPSITSPYIAFPN